MKHDDNKIILKPILFPMSLFTWCRSHRDQRRDKFHAKAFHCTKEQRRLTIVLLITALPDCWGGVRLRLCHCNTVEPRPSWLRRAIALAGSNAIARRFAWHLLWEKKNSLSHVTLFIIHDFEQTNLADALFGLALG